MITENLINKTINKVLREFNDQLSQVSGLNGKLIGIAVGGQAAQMYNSLLPWGCDNQYGRMITNLFLNGSLGELQDGTQMESLDNYNIWWHNRKYAITYDNGSSEMKLFQLM